MKDDRIGSPVAGHLGNLKEFPGSSPTLRLSFLFPKHAQRSFPGVLKRLGSSS